MKNRLTTSIKQEKEGLFPEHFEYIDLEAIQHGIVELGKKNRANRDGIRDYYYFYKL